MEHIRLTRKLAPLMDGVNLKDVNVGDVIEVSSRVAEMLVREEWAEIVGDGLTHAPASGIKPVQNK